MTTEIGVMVFKRNSIRMMFYCRPDLIPWDLVAVPLQAIPTWMPRTLVGTFAGVSSLGVG